MSILLYRCITWMLTKHIKKKLDADYTRMLWTILNKSWKQHSTKQQPYGHQPHISKTVQIRQTIHAGHCWRSKDKILSDLLQWISSHRRASVGWLGSTYLQQLCTDTACSQENLPNVMDNRDKWQERLVHWVLWHINLCRLFNAKSIFM